jgi:hypothetical protein
MHKWQLSLMTDGAVNHYQTYNEVEVQISFHLPLTKLLHIHSSLSKVNCKKLQKQTLAITCPGAHTIPCTKFTTQKRPPKPLARAQKSKIFVNKLCKFFVFAVCFHTFLSWLYADKKSCFCPPRKKVPERTCNKTCQ